MKNKYIKSLALIFSLSILTCIFSFSSFAASLAKGTITLSGSTVYTGSQIKPKVKVTLSGKTLSTKYYTVTYSNNKNVGTAKVTVSGKGGYTGKISKSFTIVPQKASALKASSITDKTLNLSWKKISGATGYVIYMNSGNGYKKLAVTSGNSYAVKNLTPGESYYFKVRTYKKVSSKNYYAPYSSALEAVTAPTLKVKPYDTSVSLSWTSVCDAEAYEIWVYSSTTDWYLYKTTTKTAYKVTGLKPGTKYYFRVRGYYKNSGEKVRGAYSPKISAVTALTDPTGLKAATLSDGTVRISWTGAASAKSYIVTVLNENSVKISETEVTNTFADISGLSGAAPYKAVVKSSLGSPSAQSPGAQLTFAKAPENPASVSLSDITSSSVKISYSGAAGATGYAVYAAKYSKNGTKLSETRLSSPKELSYTAANLEGSAYYSFKVLSYYSCGGKNYYSTGTVSEKIRLLPAKISSFAAKTTYNAAELKWQTQQSCDGYEISDEKGNLISDVKNPLTSAYTVNNLEPQKQYSFVIRSYNLDGNASRVYSESSSLTCVTTSRKVTGVAFIEKPASIAPGGILRLTVNVSPSYAENKNVSFTSSVPGVATVSSDGIVTAILPGTTKITVTTEEGSFTDSFTLTVKKVISTGISLKTQTAYVGETMAFDPVFTPSDVSSKSFTVSFADYKNNSSTLKFSDYFDIYELPDESGNGFIQTVKAKKETVLPGTTTPFAFTGTVTASDSKKSSTFKLYAVERIISVKYYGNSDPWYYGNSFTLTPAVKSSASFSASQLRWTTDNTKVATVTQKGAVKCVGTGKVTIKASSPDGSQSYSLTALVKDKVLLKKDFFENCAVGSAYDLSPYLASGKSGNYIFSLSSGNESVATLSKDGRVTFTNSGTVRISISSPDCLPGEAVLTTKASTVPTGSFDHKLDTFMKSANAIKSKYPTIEYSKATTFNNIYIAKPTNSFGSEDLADLFDEFAAPVKTTINVSSAANSADKNTLRDQFTKLVPLSTLNQVIYPGLDESKVKSLEITDDGSYTYKMKLTLKNEVISTLPANPYSTAHGKVFDILSKTHMDVISEEFAASGNKASISYKTFGQTYHDSSLTLTIDKASGEVKYMVYDMRLTVKIDDLLVTARPLFVTYTMIDSNVSFDVNNSIEIEVIS